MPVTAVVQSLLNWMSLGDTVYKVTISERGRLEQFLASLFHSDAVNTAVSGALYNKLKAALIDQDRQGFPCLSKTLEG